MIGSELWVLHRLQYEGIAAFLEVGHDHCSILSMSALCSG